MAQETLTPDLSKLINAALLQAFGEETIVPMNGTIGTLAQAVSGLSEEVDDLSGMIATGVLTPKAVSQDGNYLVTNGGDNFVLVRNINID